MTTPKQEKCERCFKLNQFYLSHTRGPCLTMDEHRVIRDLEMAPCTCELESNREPTIQESLTVEHGGFEEWMKEEAHTQGWGGRMDWMLVFSESEWKAREKAWQACAKAYEGQLEAIESEVSKVYCELTNNKFSKANTRAQFILDEVEEQLAAKEKEILEAESRAQKLVEALSDSSSILACIGGEGHEMAQEQIRDNKAALSDFEKEKQ